MRKIPYASYTVMFMFMFMFNPFSFNKGIIPNLTCICQYDISYHLVHQTFNQLYLIPNCLIYESNEWLIKHFRSYLVKKSWGL